MESKKFNAFAMFMIVFMGVFCIFMGFKNTSGQNGKDGKSAYELAVEQGLFSGTEYEYLLSLQGEDGSNITIQQIYDAYLQDKQLTASQYPISKFIQDCYPDSVLGELNQATKKSIVELATAQALRSTVDIAYSCYMNTPIISAEENSLTNGSPVYVIEETNRAAVGISAGSGVVYQVNSDTAYIITNFHVVYVNNYSNDDAYRVYYNESTGEYFTATFDETKVKTATSGSGFWGSTTVDYILQSDVELAPTSTHFLDNYDVFLYGYQEEKYALSASFVGGSAENDVAILKIDKNSSNPNNKMIFKDDYKPADLGNSSALSVGESVVAVGNPLLANTSNVETNSNMTVAEYVEAYRKSYIEALCLTATDGVVSNVSEYQLFSSLLPNGEDSNMRLIRVSSAINAGNSGGGLYDIYGRLIGIVNGKIASSDYDNVGYAIPVNIATAIADKVIAECGGVSSETSIKAVTSEKLGISATNVKDGTNAPYYDASTGLWVTYSAVMLEVMPTSTASVSGLMSDDVLLKIVIGSTEYDVNFAYEVDDILLNVKQSANSVKFIVGRVQENQVVEKEITITLHNNNFVEIV